MAMRSTLCKAVAGPSTRGSSAWRGAPLLTAPLRPQLLALGPVPVPCQQVSCQEPLANLSARPGVVCQARRGSNGSRQRSKPILDININGRQWELHEDKLWMLALPLVMLIGVAGIIGPLLIGGVMMAVAVGAALSIGAVALSFMWVPFVALAGFLFFPLAIPIGAFATLGLGIALSKLFSVAVLLAAGGLGWTLVSRLLSRPQERSVSSRLSSRGSESDEQEGPVVMADVRTLDEDDAEVRRMARELRDFDELLAQKDEQKRVDDWRRRTTGR